MSRLGNRIARLEGTGGGVKLIPAEGDPSFAEKQELAERYRREHGLPPETVVIVVGETERQL